MVRLVCRHQFHASCWTDAEQAGRRDCPNCRGSGRVIARYRYIARRPASNQSAGSRTTTTELAMPWWTARGQQPEPYFHAATQLADGRMSLLVDVGAWTNLVGSNWAREMARRAMAAGKVPKQTRMSRPLSVQGVGDGAPTASWQSELPIAITHAEGNVQEHRYTAPTLEGAGADLPALLGLQTISGHRGVLETEPGR